MGMRFKVEWEVEVDGVDALDAARRARVFQLDGESLATVFTVHDRATGETQTIDLLFEDEEDEAERAEKGPQEKGPQNWLDLQCGGGKR